jgi:hypothetical protein
MSPSGPPATVRPPGRGPKKRPWYLILALVSAWIFGAMAMTGGCDDIGFYQADRSELTRTVQERMHDADREAVAAATDKFFDAMDLAKRRAFPLGVAALLLGAAMWGLAAGAMVGRQGARTALVQVILVHAALVVLGYLILPDVRAAHTEADVRLAMLAPAPTDALQDARRIYVAARPKLPLVWMSLHLVGYGLVLVALTRRRDGQGS